MDLNLPYSNPAPVQQGLKDLGDALAYQQRATDQINLQAATLRFRQALNDHLQQLTDNGGWTKAGFDVGDDLRQFYLDQTATEKGNFRDPNIYVGWQKTLGMGLEEDGGVIQRFRAMQTQKIQDYNKAQFDIADGQMLNAARQGDLSTAASAYDLFYGHTDLMSQGSGQGSAAAPGSPAPGAQPQTPPSQGEFKNHALVATAGSYEAAVTARQTMADSVAGTYVGGQIDRILQDQSTSWGQKQNQLISLQKDYSKSLESHGISVSASQSNALADAIAKAQSEAVKGVSDETASSGLASIAAFKSSSQTVFSTVSAGGLTVSTKTKTLPPTASFTVAGVNFAMHPDKPDDNPAVRALNWLAVPENAQQLQPADRDRLVTALSGAAVDFNQMRAGISTDAWIQAQVDAFKAKYAFSPADDKAKALAGIRTSMPQVAARLLDFIGQDPSQAKLLKPEYDAAVASLGKNPNPDIKAALDSGTNSIYATYAQRMQTDPNGALTEAQTAMKQLRTTIGQTGVQQILGAKVPGDLTQALSDPKAAAAIFHAATLGQGFWDGSLAPAAQQVMQSKMGLLQAALGVTRDHITSGQWSRTDGGWLFVASVPKLSGGAKGFEPGLFRINGDVTTGKLSIEAFHGGNWGADDDGVLHAEGGQWDVQTPDLSRPLDTGPTKTPYRDEAAAAAKKKTIADAMAAWRNNTSEANRQKVIAAGGADPLGGGN